MERLPETENIQNVTAPANASGHQEQLSRRADQHSQQGDEMKHKERTSPATTESSRKAPNSCAEREERFEHWRACSWSCSPPRKTVSSTPSSISSKITRDATTAHLGVIFIICDEKSRYTCHRSAMEKADITIRKHEEIFMWSVSASSSCLTYFRDDPHDPFSEQTEHVKTKEALRHAGEESPNLRAPGDPTEVLKVVMTVKSASQDVGHGSSGEEILDDPRRITQDDFQSSNQYSVL